MAQAAAIATGFDRPEMHKAPLVGTVSLYQRHVFVCCGDALRWPSQVEAASAAELGDLPHAIFTAFKARKKDIPSKIRLTLCEEEDQGPEFRQGDVLVFPDMLHYRGLSAGDADAFVEQVMVKGKIWKGAERLRGGSYVFVCAHGSRDARCGSCGPVLVQTFAAQIGERGLDERVRVRACSHIGGHKFAGNVIIYGGTPVAGHWYGYVTPEDVPLLLEQHIQKGQVVDKLWRGQMCLTEEEQKQSQAMRVGAENLCPCGMMSLEDCGSKQQQVIKSVPKAKLLSVSNGKASVSNGNTPRKAAAAAPKARPSKWTRQDKVTATVLVLGSATAIGIWYYVSCKLK